MLAWPLGLVPSRRSCHDIRHAFWVSGFLELCVFIHGKNGKLRCVPNTILELLPAPQRVICEGLRYSRYYRYSQDLPSSFGLWSSVIFMHNIRMNPFKQRSRFTQLLQGLTMTQCSHSSSSFWAGDLPYFWGSVAPECIHAAPRQGPPAPRSQGVINASGFV